VITDYAVTTFVATIAPSWVTTPNTDSVYVVYGQGPVRVEAITTGVITADAILTDAITASEVATDAIGAAELADDAIAEIGSDLNIDHLALTISADTTDPVDMSGEVADGTVLANIATNDGDVSDFDRRFHSLEALSVNLEIQMATGLRSVQGTGMLRAVWYVNGGVTSGDGKTPTTAFGTMAEALAVCSATVDDWILVMDYSGGGGTISLTDTFCHIIGLNSSKGMPYPRFMPATAIPAFEFVNASDRVELANLVIGGGDATVPAITADAEHCSGGAYGCWIHDCVIGRDAVAAPANDGILIGADVDMPYLIVENNTFYGTWSGLVGCDQSGIEIAGNCTGGSILNNFFQGIGSSTNPAINLSGTVVGMRIQGNRIAGADDTAAGWGITLSANCTDIFVDDNHAGTSDTAPDASAFLDSNEDEDNAWSVNYSGILLTLP
jgi:hypothetical protein